ncbi:MAG TPA: protein-L-isoaspartate(D-aspartate) O-methyltransferase [Burkholderiaceae bacterium]|nr:protein-L-isoaspartate(D-aspartate) O-methyltransferase [Burkholderiaceae bacterium]
MWHASGAQNPRVKASIESARAHYAQRVTAGITDGQTRRALLEAFARVAREDFLGPPPWRVYSPHGHIATLESDPRELYHDALVVLSAEQGINNGQPSLHARCLAAVRPRPGERAVHIGAGTGYYSALLAELVGPSGQVHAYEIEAGLAERAALALAGWPQVSVYARSAFAAPLPSADVLYVNAGASHPPDEWLVALRPGGRLIFPLTGDDGGGVMLLVEQPRHALRARHDRASVVAHVQFIGCSGARDALQAERLRHAFARGGVERVRSLRRGTPPDASCWCAGSDWWLSTDE